MKIVLVTGATSGFGKAIAQRFAAEKYNVIITGRRSDRLESLQKELMDQYGVKVQVLAFDVRNFEETQSALLSLSPEWRNVDVLINNAGLAVGRDPVHDGSLEDWNRMIDTNLKGMLHVSKVVVPWLIDKKTGTIINIGSIAGREAYPGGNVYGATKFAVDGLTKSMRIDLVSHGIRVSQIAPGAAETEFSVVRFHGDKAKADKVYEGFTPLQAEDIADAAWYIASRPQHVTIQDLLIMPTAQASANVIHKS